MAKECLALEKLGYNITSGHLDALQNISTYLTTYHVSYILADAPPPATAWLPCTRYSLAATQNLLQPGCSPHLLQPGCYPQPAAAWLPHTRYSLAAPHNCYSLAALTTTVICPCPSPPLLSARPSPCGCESSYYHHHHHHHQKAFRNKSHTSHGHRPGLKRNKSKERLTII